MTYDCWGSPVKPGMTYGTGMTCGIGKTMLLSDALSCKVQIVNKIGLRFQQNRLKVNTNIVLYQNLVKDTILQTLDLRRSSLHQGLYDKISKFMPIMKV